MTIPLNNLYDYIFSLTGHTNKNLIMYRFDPHGSKNIKNLICHNNVQNIYVDLPNKKKRKTSFHYKSLFCYDQEPLNFSLYENDFDDRKNIYYNRDITVNDFSTNIDQKLIFKSNIAGNPIVKGSIYDKMLLLHSEKNSKDLEKYEENGFLGVYYWAHAFIGLDWYRFAKHDKNLNYSQNTRFEKNFNVYCRSWTGTREYRLKFLSMIKQNNIDEYSNIIFSEYDDTQHFFDYTTENNDWNIDVEEKQKIKNLIYIPTNNSCPTLSATYDSGDYHRSAIDVVLETVFDKNKIQLTEKILRPIACGKPFILVSEKGSLEYLKSYGFKTFNDLIDESYDDIVCPKKRLEKIVKTMKSISDLSQDKKNQLFSEMHQIAEHNKKWFFSKDFFNIINDELEYNLKLALNTLDNPKYQTAKSLRLWYRTYRRYGKYLPGFKNSTAEQMISDVPTRIEVSKKNIGKY